MANDIIKGAGSHHIALMASDFEKSLAFYKALGFKEVARWGDENRTIAMLDIGDGGRLELFANRGVDYPAEGRWQHFAIAVDDVPAAYELAVSLGAKPSVAPKTVPLNDARPSPIAIQVAFVEGPDGEQLEFFKQVK
jgi:catechol 2,3-dioxygenase-like lactoylglutathione lyase family enzyme